MKMLTKLILIVSSLTMTRPVAADWTYKRTDFATLPAYCLAKFDEGEGKNLAAAKMWRDSLGIGFIHVHHYCAGLILLNQARGMGSFDRGRQGTLEGALRNFDYMLSNAPGDFSLRPEILMNRGIALSMMNRTGEAIGDLLKSIEADPKQPRAYLTLAEIYEKQRNRAKALETVTEGLRHNPDTKSLQRRYTELGGKLPYPQPAETASTESRDAGSEEKATLPAGEKAGEPASPESVDATQTPVGAPKIGSPSNPYCRFCPD